MSIQFWFPIILSGDGPVVSTRIISTGFVVHVYVSFFAKFSFWYVSIGVQHLYPISVKVPSSCANFPYCMCLLEPFLMLADFCLPLCVTNLQEWIFSLQVEHSAPISPISCIRIHADSIFLYGRILFCSRHCSPLFHEPWDPQKVNVRLQYVDNIIQLDFLSTLQFHIYQTFQFTFHLVTILQQVVLYLSDVIWCASVS